MTRGLNRNQLKYIAIVAMVMDHVAWAFFPLSMWQGQALHFVGRLTGPIMAFFLAEGYLHTRSPGKYAARLAVFALLSWPTFSYFETGRWFGPYFGVIYTLLLGLLAVWIWDRAPVHVVCKVLLIGGLCWLSKWGDWPYFDVLWPLVLVMFRDETWKKRLLFVLITAVAWYWCMRLYHPWQRGLFNAGIFAAPALLFLAYNGERGSAAPFHRWFFYAFYPLHLLALGLLRWVW